MLSNLRSILNETNNINPDASDHIISAISGQNVRDAFLTDPELLVIGSENDPTIKKFIASIPEDSEVEPVSQDEIDKIIENMIPVINNI